MEPTVINILLVDDEPRNLDALEAILQNDAYRLLRSTDADGALKLLLEHDVAAIVLDIKMPGVSGLELAKLITGTKKFRQIPIVFMTAYMVDDKDVLTGYSAGAVDYLTKPVNPAILQHKVAVFADLFRKTRALAELNETLEMRVTERTAALATSESALREMNSQKDHFIATLAHELRNPLAPLRTGLDLLIHAEDRPASMDKTLTTMNRQIDHVIRLIDDLLDVSRITGGKLELRRQVMDLGVAVERAIEICAPLLASRQQTVHVEAEGPITATVDGTRIAQIVSNLVNNAAKHSENGAKIVVRLSRAEGNAVIDVIDHGAGIPAEQLERVFDMFTKIDRPGQWSRDGLGIGLALSRRLATLHGGSLTASSAGESKGSTFTLTLPTDVAAPDSAGQLPRAQTPVPSKPPALSIVLVEDNEDAATMMELWLSHDKHTVQVARTGADGIALIKAAKPDVVLCDIGLPDMDGVDVCQRVLSETSDPPMMVALTGWGAEADRRRTRHGGFSEHLVKPVDLAKLRDLLGSVAAKPRSEA